MENQNSGSKNFKNKIKTLLFFVLTISCVTLKAQSATNVFHIQSYFTEAYLVKTNGKLILIETGSPATGYADSLVKSIKGYGFNPSDISLAVVTHGHHDHAGNARLLQQKYHVPIAGSKYDLGKFTTGKTELSKCEDVSIWGTRLRQYSDVDYPSFTPDVLIEKNEVSLAKYGVDGKIIPLSGGHTPGDIAVLIGEHLFVGDAFIGTFKAQGQGIVPDGHHVREHFYHENKSLAADKELKEIQQIAFANKVTTIYPTHFGAVTTNELVKYNKNEPTLKSLSQTQTELLNEIQQGKATLANKFLSDDFVLNNYDGMQYSKTSFTESFVTKPKTKIETISAEDFRIVYADNIVVIMTFIENIKFTGKEPISVLATTTYIKVNGNWQMVFKQTAKQ